MFRRALSEGRWTVHGGASLKTYFIGACQRAFANAYRRWLREKETALTVGRDRVDLLSSRADPMADVEATVLTSLAVREGLARLDPRTRDVMLLKAEGLSHDEIAETTGMTPKAVEGIVYRHRKRMGQQDPAAGSTAAKRGGSRHHA